MNFAQRLPVLLSKPRPMIVLMRDVRKLRQSFPKRGDIAKFPKSCQKPTSCMCRLQCQGPRCLVADRACHVLAAYDSSPFSQSVHIFLEARNPSFSHVRRLCRRERRARER